MALCRSYHVRPARRADRSLYPRLWIYAHSPRWRRQSAYRTGREKTIYYIIREDLDAQFDDTSRFTVTTTYTGGAADKIRSQFEEESRKDIEDSYVKYYATWLSGIQRDRPIDYSDDSVKNELTIKEYYTIPNLWTIDKQGKRSFDFIVQMIRDYLPDIPEDAFRGPPFPHLPLTGPLYPPPDTPGRMGIQLRSLHIQNNAYQFDFTRGDQRQGNDPALFPDHFRRSYRRRGYPAIQGRLQGDGRPYFLFPL